MEGEDSDRPSGVSKAKEAPDPIHDFADDLALDLEQKDGSIPRGRG